MMDIFRAFAREDCAVTSIEYALLAALIAGVIFVAVSSAGVELGAFYGYASNCVNAATSGSSGGC